MYYDSLGYMYLYGKCQNKIIKKQKKWLTLAENEIIPTTIYLLGYMSKMDWE